jgi:uncharacterized protein (UPF0332 family)
VTPEAAGYLAKAHDLLAQAEAMLRIELWDAAGRTAYLAEFHAAQGLIFERTRKSLKTHRGVHSEFLRLTKNDARVEAELRVGMSQAYNLKTVADYEIGPGAKVSVERAKAELARATRFVARIADLIAADSGCGSS